MDRLSTATELLAGMSPYSLDEARAIIEAIVFCRPIGEIIPLLVCSPKVASRDVVESIKTETGE